MLTEKEELELLELENENAQGDSSAAVAEKPKTLSGKAWELLSIPEQKSREGLNMIANAIPEPNYGQPRTFKPTFGASGKTVTIPPSVTADVIAGIPKVAAETLAETAPGFISRGSLLTAGALKAAQLGAPVINSVGRFIGKTAESTSGLGYNTPGVLAADVNDPLLLFGKGKDAARKLYKSVQNSAQISPDIKKISEHKDLVQKALEFAEQNNLTPDEALQARKSLDYLGDTVPDTFRKATRTIFDAIAKQKFSEADKAFARATKSEALRSFWGINKSGTPSIVKGGLTTALPFTAPLFSPVVQGAAASAVGAVRKLGMPFVKNPALGFIPEPVLDRFRR